MNPEIIVFLEAVAKNLSASCDKCREWLKKAESTDSMILLIIPMAICGFISEAIFAGLKEVEKAKK